MVVGAAMRKKFGLSRSFLAAHHGLGVGLDLVLGDVHVFAGHNCGHVLLEHGGVHVLAVHGSRRVLLVHFSRWVVRHGVILAAAVGTSGR